MQARAVRHVSRWGRRGGAFLVSGLGGGGHDSPACWAALLATAGAALALLGPRAPLGAALCLLAVSLWLGVSAWAFPSRGARTGALAALAWLGGFYGWTALYEHAARAPTLLGERTARIEGRVERVEPRENGRMRVTVRVFALEGLAPEATPRRARVSAYADAAVQPGAPVSFVARLRPPNPSMFPGDGAWARRAFFEGVGAEGYVLGRFVRPHWAPPASGAEERAAALQRTRQAIAQSIRAAEPGPAGGFLAAIAVGDRSGIAQEDAEALRAAGLAHLLAISGLHMGLVGGIVFLGLRVGLAWLPGAALHWPIAKIAAGAALAAGLIYLLLAGAPVSAQRAYVMLAAALGGVIAARRAFSMRSIAIAALLILTLAPQAALDPGFHMSFLAALALVRLFAGRIDLRPDPARVGVVLSWLDRGGRFLKDVTLTSLAAGAATTPASLFFFGRAAAYGQLGNYAAMPVMTLWVAPAGALAALLAPLGLEDAPLWVTGRGVDVILAIAHGVAALPGAHEAAPDLPVAAFCLFSLAVFAGCVGGHGRWTLAACLALAAAVSWRTAPAGAAWSDGAVLAVRAMDPVQTADLGFHARRAAERLGVGPDGAGPEEHGMRCDPDGCRLDLRARNGDHRILVWAREPAAFETACGLAHAIVAEPAVLRAAPPGCGALLTPAREDDPVWIALRPDGGFVFQRTARRAARWLDQ